MPEPTPVRKLPVTVEAMQWPGGLEAARPIIDWILDSGGRIGYYEAGQSKYPEHLVIDTLEGDMRALPGDWIICGVKGEFYPCKPDVFVENFEVVEPPSRREIHARAEAETRFITAAGGKPPTDEQKAAVAGIREMVVDLATRIMLDVPDTRDREIALEELETFHMRANRAIFATRGIRAFARGGILPAGSGPFFGGGRPDRHEGIVEMSKSVTQRISEAAARQADL